MGSDNSNPNIEWKKTEVDPSERVGLKIDVKKAIEQEAKDKTNVQRSFSTPEKLPIGLNKIRKKIREAYDDEEEDEDDYQAVASPLEAGNSLINALNDDEKKILKQQDLEMQGKLLENAGKIAAVNTASQFIKNAEIKNVSRNKVIDNILEANPNDKNLAYKAIKETIREETGIKMPRKLDNKELAKLSKGIGKVKKLGVENLLEGMKANDVINAGEDKKDTEVAQLILEKTGRKESDKKRIKTIDKINLNKKEKRLLQEKMLKDGNDKSSKERR